jgi:hypothetical protein
MTEKSVEYEDCSDCKQDEELCLDFMKKSVGKKIAKATDVKKIMLVNTFLDSLDEADAQIESHKKRRIKLHEDRASLEAAQKAMPARQAIVDGMNLRYDCQVCLFGIFIRFEEGEKDANQVTEAFRESLVEYLLGGWWGGAQLVHTGINMKINFTTSDWIDRFRSTLECIAKDYPDYDKLLKRRNVH